MSLPLEEVSPWKGKFPKPTGGGHEHSRKRKQFVHRHKVIKEFHIQEQSAQGLQTPAPSRMPGDNRDGFSSYIEEFGVKSE